MGRDESLWDYAETRDQRLLDQLATSLIGIGALFFAYGSIQDPFVRMIISLVGLGGSLALWLHATALHHDRNGAYVELARSQEGRALLKRWFRAGGWRDAPRVKRWYVSSVAFAKWLMGWIAAAWMLIIIVNDFSAARFSPFSPLQTKWLTQYSPILLSVVAGVALLSTFLYLHRATLNDHGIRAEAVKWPEPAESTNPTEVTPPVKPTMNATK